MFTTDKMVWNPKTRQLTCSISDFPHARMFGADTYVKSHHTGRVVKFVHMRIEQNKAGDIVGWHFSNTTDFERGIALLVIND